MFSASVPAGEHHHGEGHHQGADQAEPVGADAACIRQDRELGNPRKLLLLPAVRSYFLQLLMEKNRWILYPLSIGIKMRS